MDALQGAVFLCVLVFAFFVLFLFFEFRIIFHARKEKSDINAEGRVIFAGLLFGFGVDMKNKEMYLILMGRKVIRKTLEQNSSGSALQGSKPHFFKAEWIKPVIFFACRVISSFKLTRFSLKLDLGLEDPYETGMLAGFLPCFLYPFNALPAADIRVNPRFDDCFMFDGRTYVEVSNRIVNFIEPTIRFLKEIDVVSVLKSRF